MFRFRPGMVFAVACVGFILGVGSSAWSVSWLLVVGVVVVLGVVMMGRMGNGWLQRIVTDKRRQIKDSRRQRGREDKRRQTGDEDERRQTADYRYQKSFIFYLQSFICRLLSTAPWLLLFFFASLLGSWRYADVQPGLSSVAVVADEEEREVQGTVVRIQERERGLSFTLTDVVVDGEAREDRVLVRVPFFSQGSIGERVAVSCALERPEPFEDFAYDRYLAAKDIVAVCSSRSSPFIFGKDEHTWMRFLAAIDVLHQGSVDAIDAVLPEPHAQLLAGLLLGDDAFSSVWQDRFLRTGTSHIVAASGSNVALVVSLVLGLFFAAGIHRRYASIFAIGGIIVFVVLAGGESAVLRAGIMASLIVLARFIGRASSVRNVILFTVCMMLFFEPRILRDDVGFQLSVLSTIGLIFWAKSFAKKMIFIPEKFGLREGFATTLAATLATLPVTLLSMGQISFVGPVANFLVLPLLPLAMAGGAVATVVGMVWPWLGRMVAFPVWWMLDTVLMILRELSELSFVYAKVNPLVAAGVLGMGGILLLGIRFLIRHAGLDPASSASRNDGSRVGARDDRGTHANQKTSLLVPLIFVSLFLLSFSQHVVRDGWFSSDVRVWVFDIGQGDAIFIDTPEKDVMIDGGPSTVVREKVGMVLPWFDRTLEYAFVTHPHADHVVGLVPILEHYAVQYMGESDQGCTSLECFGFQGIVSESAAILSGDVFVLAPGVTLRAVWPQEFYRGKKISDPNDGSLVFLLETPHGSMLFTGDAGIEEEHAFLELLPDRVDVLKVGHHGSRTSTSNELLEALRSSYGIISLGENNSFQHPHEEVIERLQTYGVEIYRTDLAGDIRVEFKKEGIFVDAFHL